MSQSSYPTLNIDHGAMQQENLKQEDLPNQPTTCPLSPYNNNATADQEVQWSGFQPQLPLPSQLLSQNFQMQSPPSEIFSETMPTVRPLFTKSASDESSSQPAPNQDPNFAKRANDLINQVLGRTAGGTSVIEPDSVLGESGRLYHGYKDGKYLLPNDAAEQDRLDLQHQVWLLLLDKWLHLAPMTTVPKYVLDVATGTGIWAHDFAEKYPSSFVIGTDLSAIQPDPRVTNLVFQKDDAEATWVFPAPHPPGTDCVFPCEHRIMFDYVHLRAVVTCFDDHLTVMQHAFDNMNPGGWIEFQDASFYLENDTGSEDSPFKKYLDGCIRGAAALGRDLRVPEKYKTYLEQIGFVDVQERVMILPASPWAKDPRLREAGLYNLQNLLEGIRAIGWKMLKAAGYGTEEVERMVHEAREWIRDCKNQPYTTMYVVYGRKPLA